jgi:HK97 family phage major capsid protein
MSDELNELQNITHHYRRSLEAYEARTGRAPQTVDTRGAGEEKEKFARMDADLTAIELLAQNKALEARLAKLEAEPTLEARAPRATSYSDTDSPEFAARWLRAGMSGSPEFRVLTKGSTTNAPVPTDMERRIVERLYQSSVIRQIAKVSTIDSNRTIRIESTLPTAYIVDETANATLSDPAYKSISVSPWKFVAATKMSQEFIDDAIGNGGVGSGLNYVADRLAIALAKLQDEKFTIGAGAASSEPQGIADCSSTAWATTNADNIINQGVALTEDQTVANISADNVIDCVMTPAPQYRNSPRYRCLLSDACLRAIRKLKQNSEYIWSLAPSNPQNLAGPVPGLICGVPYSISEYLPSTAAQATTGANVRGSALFIAGHWDFFEIFDRTGMQSIFDPFSSSLSLQSTLAVWMRTDSKITLPEAFAAIYSPNAN